jgi:hypothetical protein
VVIDQVMYKANGGDEYIRLHNTSEQDVMLSSDGGDWYLGGGISYQFSREDGVPRIPAGGHALVVPTEPGAFRQSYAVPAEVPVFGPFQGALNNGGESVILFRPGLGTRSVMVDRVTYDNQTPWPAAAATGDVALVRISPEQLGDDPASWTVSQQATGTHLGDGIFLQQRWTTGAAVNYGHDAIGRATFQAVAGDADGDGRFISRDLLRIFQEGKYRSGQPADWTQGDWNHDGRFNERDLMLAFQRGAYVPGAAPPFPLDPHEVTWVDAIDQLLAAWSHDDQEEAVAFPSEFIAARSTE